MKKILSNNHGYTLFIVLMTIVIFTILALSFTVQTASSKKQNMRVEENYQSKALAEMGSEYYMIALKNEFDDMQIKAEEAQKSYLSRFNAEDISDSTIQEARRYGIEVAYSYFIDQISGIQNSKVIDGTPSNPNYKIVPNEPIRNGDSLSITFDSIGSIDNHKTTINGVLEIDLAGMYDPLKLPTKDNYFKPSKPKESNLIPNPDPNNTFKTCKPDNYEAKNGNGNNSVPIGTSIKCDNNNTQFIVNGNVNNLNIKDSVEVFYINGRLTDHNSNFSVNSKKKLYLYVGFSGDNYFGNLNGVHNARVEVMGNAVIKNVKGNTSNVTFCVHGTISGYKTNSKSNNIYFIEEATSPEEFTSPTGKCYGWLGETGDQDPEDTQIPTWEWNIPMITKEDYEYK